jgi:nucleotide-binding universal stress UspA family protein
VPSDLIVIAFDGSAASERALRAAAELFPGRKALVISVWNERAGFEAVQLPPLEPGLPPAPIDVRAAREIEHELQHQAQHMAHHGAELARQAGLDAEGLAVADDVDAPVAETIVNVADERDAAAIVVGGHGHGRISEVLLGSTTRDVIRRSSRPVLVTREPDAG